MQTTFHPLFRAGAVLTAFTLAAAAPSLAADNTDAFPKFESYIKISGQAPSISGSEASFARRLQQPKNGGAGIEELHFTKELANEQTLTVDGRALAGSEDYLGKLHLTKTEVGSAEIGYKRFRTFYDGVGGFFPVTGSFQTLNPRDLYLDRGEFWAEARIARPNAPEFTVRYTNGTRNGQKDSIMWGDSDNSGQVYRLLNGGLSTVGVTATSNSNATVRKNTPSYLDISERHETIEGTMKHTVGKTTSVLTLIGDKASKNNLRYVVRFPGETLGVLPGATVIVAPVAMVSPASEWMSFNNQVAMSTYDIQDTTTKGAMLTTVTELSPKLSLDADAKYEYVHATFSGDRMTVSNSPVAGDLTRTLTAYPVRNLVGKSDVEVWTAKAALDYKATENLEASLALRYEDESANGKSGFDVITASSAVPPVIATTSRLQNAVVEEDSLTPELNLSFTGIKDLALYTTVSKKMGDGTDVQTPAYNPATTTFQSVIYRDINDDKLDWTIGASWRASAALSLRGEVFLKDHSFQSTGWNTNTNAPTAPTLDNNYQLDSQFRGAKLTAIVKPLDVLGFTARYVYQKGERTVTGFLALYPEYDSMDLTTHNFGVSVDWTPRKQFYAQANLDVVFNVIRTVSLHDLSVSAPGVIPANRIIPSADNNYTTGSLVAGAVLTKTDDLQFQFTYYKADNYNAQLALYTQPYAASAKEMVVSANLKHKFSNRMMGNIKLGYVDSQSDTTGGRTDFHGPLAYVSLDYSL